MFAFTRSQKMDFHYLQAMTNHARRQDSVSLERVCRDRTKDNLICSAYCSDATDLRRAYAERKALTGAKEYGKAAVGIHIIAGVSPEYISREGDPHDPRNPANFRVFEHAQAWAEKEFGPGSVISARMDMDEAGSGVVDLFIVPVREMKMRGKTKSIVSVNKALDEIREKYGKKGDLGAYSSLNTSWVKYAQEHLDSDLKRGVSKEESGREHVISDVFREEAEKIRRAKEEIVHQNEIIDSEKLEIESIKKRQNDDADLIIGHKKKLREERKVFGKNKRKFDQEKSKFESWWGKIGMSISAVMSGRLSVKSLMERAFNEGFAKAKEERAKAGNDEIKRLENKVSSLEYQINMEKKENKEIILEFENFKKSAVVLRKGEAELIARARTDEKSSNFTQNDRQRTKNFDFTR
ncbi:plasmid recombination protein [Acetobacter farinalis]|uniref:Plasmid recombination protein n=1 Tax=Acetobacter farinalis TaxID=1260984 RepID=A0ABT3QAI7_9PROT|nr:plasmid recombination protein [Acetobacter farinalis]MCX2562302.1 plasmid recombination protein [Acetobacter farinalis]NHO30915.1 hypothetical protein [Acetobacter farinalis]